MKQTSLALTLIVLGSAGCTATGPPAGLAEIQSRPLPTTPQILSEELEVMVEIDQEARFGG